MSRFAQIRSAISDRPWEWVSYLLVAIYAAVVFRYGLVGTLLAFVAISLFGRFFLLRIRRRHPGSELSEIGTIEMEIAAWTAGLSGKFVFGTFILFSVLWLILLCHEAVTIIESHFRDVGEDSDLGTFIAETLIFAGCAKTMYTSYRNQWRRLLITDQGLFQVVDTKRPWPSDRPLDESNSPLRAVRLYCWEQIARFHWSQQSGEHVLHLNVHQPGIGVPQLVSFQLRSLSEKGWQKLDHLLRTHLSAMSSQEPGKINGTGSILITGRKGTQLFDARKSCVPFLFPTRPNSGHRRSGVRGPNSNRLDLGSAVLWNVLGSFRSSRCETLILRP
jgi:hypothetical protein